MPVVCGKKQRNKQISLKMNLMGFSHLNFALPVYLNKVFEAHLESF